MDWALLETPPKKKQKWIEWLQRPDLLKERPDAIRKRVKKSEMKWKCDDNEYD